MVYSTIVNAEGLSPVSSGSQQEVNSTSAVFNAKYCLSTSSGSQQEGIGSTFVNAENCSSVTEPIESSLKSGINRSELSVLAISENGWNEMPSRVVNLSNSDRLLLRKQALKLRNAQRLLLVISVLPYMVML